MSEEDSVTLTLVVIVAVAATLTGMRNLATLAQVTEHNAVVIQRHLKLVH